MLNTNGTIVCRMNEITGKEEARETIWEYGILGEDVRNVVKGVCTVIFIREMPLLPVPPCLV